MPSPEFIEVRKHEDMEIRLSNLGDVFFHEDGSVYGLLGDEVDFALKTLQEFVTIRDTPTNK